MNEEQEKQETKIELSHFDEYWDGKFPEGYKPPRSHKILYIFVFTFLFLIVVASGGYIIFNKMSADEVDQVASLVGMERKKTANEEILKWLVKDAYVAEITIKSEVKNIYEETVFSFAQITNNNKKVYFLNVEKDNTNFFTETFNLRSQDFLKKIIRIEQADFEQKIFPKITPFFPEDFVITIKTDNDLRVRGDLSFGKRTTVVSDFTNTNFTPPQSIVLWSTLNK
jgi:hypothetical protein